jgi:hypothetical protein
VSRVERKEKIDLEELEEEASYSDEEERNEDDEMEV